MSTHDEIAREGINAFMSGWCEDECPYPKNCRSAFIWASAFKAAAAAAEKKTTQETTQGISTMIKTNKVTKQIQKLMTVDEEVIESYTLTLTPEELAAIYVIACNVTTGTLIGAILNGIGARIENETPADTRTCILTADLIAERLCFKSFESDRDRDDKSVYDSWLDIKEAFQ